MYFCAGGAWWDTHGDAGTSSSHWATCSQSQWAHSAVCCVPSMLFDRLGVLSALNLQCFQHTIGILECSTAINQGPSVLE